MRVTRKVFSIYSEEDLISAIEEKAFCEGYIAAQKEFGNKENKRKRREWELKMSGGRSASAMARKKNPDVVQLGGSKRGFGVPINKEAYIDIIDAPNIGLKTEAEILGLEPNIKNAELVDEAIDINTSRFNNKTYVDQLDALKKQDYRFKYVIPKNTAKERREEVMKKEREKRAKELEEYTKNRLSKAEAEPVSTVVKEGAEESGKNIEKGLSRFKKPALIGAGIIGTAGLAYGGKKLYDKYKKKEAE